MDSFLISRLSELKQQGNEEAAVAGREAGENWAESIASPAELDRLERLVSNPYGNDFMEALFWNCRVWGGPHNALVLKISGVRADNFDPSMGEEFWEEVGVNIEEYHFYVRQFLAAFVEGALSIWRSVANEI